MPGYSIWYLLKPNHLLHDRVAEINTKLGLTPLPAHIPVLNNIQILSTAHGLFQSYNKKEKPIFTFAKRPMFLSFETEKRVSMKLDCKEQFRSWEFPVLSRKQMFFHDEVAEVSFDQDVILPEEYDLVIMDTRYLDKRLWKPIDGRL